MRRVMLSTSWFVLALITLFLVVSGGYPSVLVAFVAWAGGIGTNLMYGELCKSLAVRKWRDMPPTQ